MADDITEERMNELKEAFSIFDKVGDGVITTADFAEILKSLGQNQTDVEIQDMLHQRGLYGDTLNFLDFIALMAPGGEDKIFETLKDPQAFLQKCREIVHVFETVKAKNGFISTADLRQALKNLDENFTDDEIEDMIRKADPDSEGQVNYEEEFFDEFFNIMKSR